MSFEGQKNIKNVYQEVFAAGGTNAYNKVKSSFEKVSNKENREKLAEVYNEAMQNDYSLEELEQRIQDIGLESQISTSDLKEFTKSFQSFEKASEEASENFNNIKTVENAVKAHQNITSEQITQLEKAGVHAKKYFAQMADGTWALTKNSQEFLKIAKKAEKKQFKETRDTYAEKVKNIDNALVPHYKDNWYEEQVNDPNRLQRQITALKAIDYDEEKIKEWQNKLKEGSLTDDLDAVSALNDAVKNSSKAFDDMRNNLLKADIQLASTAKDVKELDKMLEKGEISSQAYLTVFQELDAQQDYEGLDPQELEDYQEYLEDIAKTTDALSDSLKKNHVASDMVAKGIMKMNIGVKTLSENWKNWSSILKKSSKYSEEYARAFMGTRGALSKLLDVDKNSISLKFVKDNLDTITKASKGSGDAIDDLKKKLYQVFKKDFFKDWKNRKIKLDLEINEKEARKKFKKVEEALKSLKGKENKIGFTIDKNNRADVLKTIQDLVKTTKMSGKEINSMLDDLNYEVHWKKETIPQYQEIVNTETDIVPEGGTPAEGQSAYDTFGNLLHYKTVTKTISPSEKIKIGETEVLATAHGKNGVPKITGLTKKAPGSANDHSTTNGGGGKRSNGGGGSSAKGKAAKAEKYRPDPYIKVNRLIEENTHQMNLNNKALEKHNYLIENAFGAEKANYLKQSNAYLEREIRLLNRSTSLQRSKLRIANKEWDQAVRILRKNGASLDKEGNFTSAGAENAFLKMIQDRKNKLDKQYKQADLDIKKAGRKAKKKADEESNKEKRGSKKEKAGDKTNDALKKNEERKYRIQQEINELEKWYNTYVANRGIRQTAEETIMDNANQLLQKKIEKLNNNKEAWQIKIDVKIEDIELKKSWNNFLSNIAKNTRLTFVNTKQQIESVKKNFNLTTKELNKYEKVLHGLKIEFDGMQSGFKSDKFLLTSGSAQEIVDKYKEAQSYAENLLDLTNEAWGAYDTEVNNVLGYFDKINSKFTDLTNILDYDLKLIKLFYDENSKDYINANNKILESQNTVYNKEIEQRKNQNTYLEKMLNIDKNTILQTLSLTEQQFHDIVGISYEDYLNTSKNEEAITNKIKENINVIKEDTLKILENEDAIYQNWNKIANIKLRNTLSSFFNQTKNADNYERQKKEWDYYLKNSQTYLDPVEKSYQIMTLANQVIEDKNKSTNLATQQKLQDYYDREIKYLKERKNLTETDVRLAKERYDILLKQIALEEAQKSKDSMKMVRDTNGNWTYQYVADADAVNKAKDDYDKANYNYYKDTKKSLEEARSKLYSDLEEYEKELEEASKIEDKEERDKRVTQINDYYSNLVQKDAEDISNKWGFYAKALTAIPQIFGEDFLTDDQKKIVEIYKAHGYGKNNIYGSYWYDLSSGATSDEERKKINSMILGSSDLASEGFIDFSSENAVRNMISTHSLETMKRADVRDERKELAANKNQYEQDAVKVESDAGNIKTEDATENLSSLASAANELQGAFDALVDSLKEYQTMAKNASLYLNSKKQEGKYTFDGEKYYKYSFKQLDEKGKEITYYTIENSDGDVIVDRSDKDTVNQWISEQKEIKKQEKEEEKSNKKKKTKTNSLVSVIASGATGMYTGDWSGDNGKLAILHKKEIVLNEDDTKNMLRMVEIARNSAKMQDFYNNALTSMNLKYPSLAKNETEKCGDVYNVTAEFPNANDVTTIKNAILSLPNIVTQQVHERTIL